MQHGSGVILVFLYLVAAFHGCGASSTCSPTIATVGTSRDRTSVRKETGRTSTCRRTRQDYAAGSSDSARNVSDWPGGRHYCRPGEAFRNYGHNSLIVVTHLAPLPSFVSRLSQCPSGASTCSAHELEESIWYFGVFSASVWSLNDVTCTTLCGCLILPPWNGKRSRNLVVVRTTF